MKKHIILVGFMGSGKSVIGKVLSRKANIKLIDIDKEIEEIEGIKITEIFKNKGEEYFRNLETEIITKLITRGEVGIISTGGGLPVKNEDLLVKEKCVIYLKASVDTIYGRIKNNKSRPLISGTNPKNTIEVLMNERESIYSRVSNYTVETDNKTVDEVCEEIWNEIINN